MKTVELQTIENTTNGTARLQHVLELPPCCPVSKNPRPGSVITISYSPCGRSLDIISLTGYIHTFIGGKRDEQGELVVRDMEGMLMAIARHCAQTLGQAVTLEADLQLVPRQRMKFSVEVTA
jgi:hypothetical protein